MPRWFMLSAVCVLLLTGCNGGTQTDSKAPDAETASKSPDTSPDESGSPAAEERERGSTSKSSAGGEVAVGRITLTAPEGWRQQPPSSQFVSAEFVLPRAEGDSADGRLTLSVAGGTIEENINRWRDQFGENPAKDDQQEIDTGGLRVTIVDLAGEFNGGGGPFAPATKRPGYRMLGAIVPVDNELHFIKATGPEKTMAGHAEAINAFIRSVRKR